MHLPIYNVIVRGRYDAGGVFTGSATVLNDEYLTPMLSYSVSTNNMQCLAFPTNR